MNTRRKFLLHGSMAATALLAANPFKAIAASNNSLTQLFGSRQNHIVFMHTAGLQTENHFATLQFIRNIKSKTTNAILVDAGNCNSNLTFDASVTDDAFAGEDYRIIKKGGINTGIITIIKNEDGIIKKINQLASCLKEEKKCQVVVCVSQLGFNHKNKLDDKELAAQSQNIDLIIGAHPDNFAPGPLVLANSKRQEVIVQSAASNTFAFGKVELGFDAQGNKNHVHILHKVPNKEGQQAAIIAA